LLIRQPRRAVKPGRRGGAIMAKKKEPELNQKDLYLISLGLDRFIKEIEIEVARIENRFTAERLAELLETRAKIEARLNNDESLWK
jgi:hypothetical protein